MKIITILGHTAGGKTLLAAHVAAELGGEVISADSRQVYRGMTIGTGKDYADYLVNGKKVPYHLVDIADAGYEYNVFEFQKDFYRIWRELSASGKPAVLCGGTGLYIESVLRQYEMVKVPVNIALRKDLESKDLSELRMILSSFGSLHNTTDILNKKRAVRAIEIAEYFSENAGEASDFPAIETLTIGVAYDREERRQRITSRLKERLESGMTDEVRGLLESGVSNEKLEYYGLEYKFLSRYLAGVLSRDEMFSQLNTAIHRFAKRQMTYFRGMEKRGIPIHWLDATLPLEDKVNIITELYRAT